MTISRGQMNRQLYEGGGIMSLSKEGIGGGDYKGYDMGSRTGFGIIKKITRGAKKAVKGATKAVKKIASSDLGKAALLTAGGAYALGLGPFGGAGSLSGIRGAGFARGLLPSTVDYKTPLRGFFSDVGKKITSSGIGKSLTSGGNLGKLATLGAVSTFLTSQYGMTEEQAEEELARDPATYLRRYYTNLNPNAGSEEIEAFVTANTSEYAEGGRIGYALGDSASDNAMQAAGIEGLPIRQNPKGVKELDLRETGGFIPPVGIKEKEDDIPAMLSNNEFVFTADAVRGMGDGDVDVGAQRMYDMMKQLEAGGRV